MEELERVDIDEFIERFERKYALVLLAAQRARQLNKGARKVVNSYSQKNTIVALEELASGKIGYEI